MGNRMTLAKLQMMRDRDRRENDDRPGMAYYPPHRYPGVTYEGHVPPDGRRRRDDGVYDRRIGFGEDGGHEREEREPVRFGGVISMEDGRRQHRRMTREIAEEWTESMHGSDPAKPSGAKWAADQIKPIAQKYGIPTEGERFWEFFAVMNAMYSDYYAVAKKYNMLTPDFFADMAMAFISDKDAVENKTMMYYECIVDK